MCEHSLRAQSICDMNLINSQGIIKFQVTQEIPLFHFYSKHVIKDSKFPHECYQLPIHYNVCL